VTADKWPLVDTRDYKLPRRYSPMETLNSAALLFDATYLPEKGEWTT
jgi:hypothetical protein